MTEPRNHDFTQPRLRWGHSLEAIRPGRFTTWSTPAVEPGDTITYTTQDHRTVTYRVLEDGYKWFVDPGDMAIFNAEKESTDD